MLPHHQPDRVRIAFDDHRLVANAGLILPSTPVYPGVGGEPTPDDIGPGQVSRPVVRPGPARHVPSRALDFRGAQHTPSAPGSVLSNHTNRNYARAWTAFSRWCGNRGIPALPARPGDIVMYLDKMAGQGRRVTTIRAARAAISHGHRTAGYAAPQPMPASRPSCRVWRSPIPAPRTRRSHLLRQSWLRSWPPP